MLYPAELRVLKKKGWVTGLEPMASGTTIPRSYQLSYTHHVEGISLRAIPANGAAYTRAGG